MHSDQNIISNFSAMEDGTMAYRNIIPNYEVRHPRMDDTIILNTAIASNPDSELIRP